MKLNGQVIDATYRKDVVFERTEVIDGKVETRSITLTVQGITNEDEFDKLCPKPLPPAIKDKYGNVRYDLNDIKYKTAVMEWATMKADWLIITSLRATEGLEWETVDYSNPDTWHNYKSELTSAGFTQNEIARILMASNEVNGFTPEMIEAASKSFLPQTGV